ncbi:NAD(P)H-hydrate epimerase, partial [Klebsiella pneumoniae]|nr:NAD(P)H-hydrate epimerase [Klebsiella pneumoniae]
REQSDLAIQALKSTDFIVDALFGSGLSRTLANLEAKLIETVNANRTAEAPPWVLSVDLPSGIEGRSGQILGAAIQADATVTFAVAKPG